jgi:hypothetical protein
MEESIYSIFGYGAKSTHYDGTTYLKEAMCSRQLQAWEATDPLHRKARQFLFVGSDFCYETLGFEQPSVRTFESLDAAYRWRPDRGQGFDA